MHNPVILNQTENQSVSADATPRSLPHAQIKAVTTISRRKKSGGIRCFFHRLLFSLCYKLGWTKGNASCKEAFSAEHNGKEALSTILPTMGYKDNSHEIGSKNARAILYQIAQEQFAILEDRHLPPH